jgi:hypothetical protein
MSWVWSAFLTCHSRVSKGCTAWYRKTPTRARTRSQSRNWIRGDGCCGTCAGGAVGWLVAASGRACMRIEPCVMTPPRPVLPILVARPSGPRAEGPGPSRTDAMTRRPRPRRGARARRRRSRPSGSEAFKLYVQGGLLLLHLDDRMIQAGGDRTGVESRARPGLQLQRDLVGCLADLHAGHLLVLLGRTGAVPPTGTPGRPPAAAAAVRPPR